MATITLVNGDFGAGATVSVGEEELFLPDRGRPGMSEPVPLTAIAEVESIADDHSGQIKEAARLGARGFLAFGPIGIAAGMLGARKVKEVKFSVRLQDGRGFTATADAITYAALRSARQSGRMSAADVEEADARADELIAKYLREKQAKTALPPEEVAAPALPAAPSPVAPDVAQPADDPALKPAATERPVFGRRRGV
jgi:hypothetical protein